MSVKDNYIDLCEARIEALTKEVEHLKNFIIRDYSLKGISAEGALGLFEAFKIGWNEDTRGGTQIR